MANNKKKKSVQNAPVNYVDLFYMTPLAISAKELAGTLQGSSGLTVELWTEMNVLEVVLPNQNSLDFESVPIDFKDSSDAAFVRNRGIRTIFAINLNENDLAAATPLFEQLVAKHAGFVCADSEDFQPVYAGITKI